MANLGTMRNFANLFGIVIENSKAYGFFFKTFIFLNERYIFVLISFYICKEFIRWSSFVFILGILINVVLTKKKQHFVCHFIENIKTSLPRSLFFRFIDENTIYPATNKSILSLCKISSSKKINFKLKTSFSRRVETESMRLIGFSETYVIISFIGWNSCNSWWTSVYRFPGRGTDKKPGGNLSRPWSIMCNTQN